MKLFLSHQWNDKHIVKRIAIEMIIKGFDPILDIWEFIPGDSLTQSMINGVLDSTCFILFWSKHAERSQNIKFERELGLIKNRKGKGHKIICVLLDFTPLPFELSDRIYIDWRKGKRKGALFLQNFNQLCRAIKGLPIEQKPQSLIEPKRSGILIENDSGLVLPIESFINVEYKSTLKENEYVISIYSFGNAPRKIDSKWWRGDGIEIRRITKKRDNIIKETIKMVSEADPEIEFCIDDPTMLEYADTFSMASASALYKSACYTFEDSKKSLVEKFLRIKNACYIYGEKNRGVYPGEKLLHAAGIPIFYIENAGHSMAIENPKQLYSVIRTFIDRLSPS